MQHGTVNHVIDLAGDTATGRSDVIVQVQLDDHTWITGGGTYRDEYRRVDDRWHIARRTVTGTFDLGPLSKYR